MGTHVHVVRLSRAVFYRNPFCKLLELRRSHLNYQFVHHGITTACQMANQAIQHNVTQHGILRLMQAASCLHHSCNCAVL